MKKAATEVSTPTKKTTLTARTRSPKPVANIIALEESGSDAGGNVDGGDDNEEVNKMFGLWFNH